MTIPGKYAIIGAGLSVLKPKLYPKFETGGLPSNSSGQGFPKQEIEISNRMSVGGDGEEALSWLGTPVFADIRIKSDVNEDDALGLYLDTVLITVTQEKNIIKTAVNGRNGTIKEYYSDGDYSISIEGAIVGRDAFAYPEADVKNLIRLMRQPASIVAVSPFLQLFGIYDITIENFELKQLEGFQNMQPFTIQCSSDLPIELIDVEDDF